MEAPDLKNNWVSLAQKYSDDIRLIKNLIYGMEKQYTYANRHYHNLEHIQAMLNNVEAYQLELEDADAVRFAVWFHDVIYQPIRTDNEEKSADFAVAALQQLDLPLAKITQVKALILRTKNHSEHLANESSDVQFFLDFDLTILGANWDKYQEYTEQIRLEYHMFPDFMYKAGRAKMLRKFLELPFIYRTSHFRSSLEKQAKENIQKELILLS
ncbi:MAG: hypothetical protein V4714_23055 [Bacteroidota bacterium]